LKAAGKRLWVDLQDGYSFEAHETLLVLELCRAADRLAELSAEIGKEGMVDPSTGRVTPAAVEARQLGISYARLMASLRLPAGTDEEQARGVRGSRRPQKRSGFRGVYIKRVQ
jgi:hypothetical protein